MGDDCLHMPTPGRCLTCLTCQTAHAHAEALARMNNNRLTALAKDINLPDADWLVQLHRHDVNDLHRLLEETQ